MRTGPVPPGCGTPGEVTETRLPAPIPDGLYVPWLAIHFSASAGLTQRETGVYPLGTGPLDAPGPLGYTMRPLGTGPLDAPGPLGGTMRPPPVRIPFGPLSTPKL